MLKVCLLYDAENIGGDVPRAKKILADLREHRLQVIKVGLVSKRHNLARLAEFFQQYAWTQSEAAPPGNDRGDILLSVMAGMFLGEALHKGEVDGVVLASNDKKVALAIKAWVDQGFEAFAIVRSNDPNNYYPRSFGEITVLPLVYEQEHKKKSTASRPAFDPSKYPYIYEQAEITKGLDGLAVLEIPQPRDPLPKFIPFPLTGEEITVGSLESCDISLRYWEKPKQLYSPHVYFGLLHEGWYIRSAKGHRTRDKAVLVNRKNIDASIGNVSVTSGDFINFGGFRFELVAVDILKHPTVNSISSNYDRVVHIERYIHRLTSQILSSQDENWWQTLIPVEIRENCESRQQDSTVAKEEHPFRFSYIREVEKIIAKNWGLFNIHPFFANWPSKSKFRKAMSRLVIVRNAVMHPTRKEIAEKEEALLKRLVIATYEF